MTGFVDIHSHLLFGIDDGPETLEDSLAMARAAVAAGTAVLAATPHLHAGFPKVHIEEVGAHTQRMQAAIDEAGIELQVVPGAETSLIWALEATEEHLRLATYGQRGADLLVETPDDVSMIEQLLYQLRHRGVRVTLAHPERSEVFRRKPEILSRLHEQGILLQVNATGLLRGRSEGGRLIEHLAREGLATAVSSDGHRGAEWRPVGALADGVSALTQIVGPERALWMARDAPTAIIAGQPIPIPPAVVRASRGVFPRSGAWGRRRAGR
jgi:protein-tyrosine phosphatase